MSRRFKAGDQIIVASHNPGKLVEIADLIKPFGVKAISASDLDLPEPEETGSTFVENAVLKAEAAATKAGLPALADDSGLEVHSLGGAPGIYSARWGGPEKDFNKAMEKVMAELASRDAISDEQRSANFTCALALAWPDGFTDTFVGHVHGHLVWPMRGNKGFGYDPIFVPNGFDITFGEMEPERKHAMSHRADAFQQLVAAYF